MRAMHARAMWMVVLVTACGAGAANAPPQPVPAQQAAPHRYRDLEPGEVMSARGILNSGIERGLREAVPLLSPCAAALAPGDQIRIGFDVDSDGRVIHADVTPATIAACASNPVPKLVFVAPLLPF